MAKNQPEIVYSELGDLYYIGTGNPEKGHFPRFWLGVQKLKREEAEKYKGAALEGAVWYESKTGGESYGRLLLGFTFWKVKSGRKERISRTSELCKDYRSAQEAR